MEWGEGSQLSSPLCGDTGPTLPPGEKLGQAGTHHGAELHHQQVGGHLRALGQALEQVAVLQGPVEPTG